MKHLLAATRGILKRVEEQTGKSIQFMRDEKLSLLATLQMARNGADYHVLRYRDRVVWTSMTPNRSTP